VRGVANLRTRTTAKGETQFAIYYRDRDTGKQHQRTLAARTLKDAKREVRATLAAADARTAVAPSRVTVDTAADELVASMRARVDAGQTAPRTLETLVHRLKPVRKALGRREVQRVTPDTCAKVGHDLGASAFVALRRVLSFAVRRGYLMTNPCDSLERGERPSPKSVEVVVLTADELHRLLDCADARTRPLLATAALSGLRQSELLALRWEDIDFDAEIIRIRHQLSRGSAAAPARLAPLKTDASAREVVLVPALASLLREHRAQALRAGQHSSESFLFSTRDGKPLAQRNATRSLARIARAAGLEGMGYHTLRHGFASTLIIELRLDPVVVSRQLGHARPSITLDRYSHLFDRARHAEDLRERLQASGLAAAVGRRATVEE
jgi:integrase